MATKTTSTTSRNQGASAAMPQQVFMVGNNKALEEIKDKLTNSSKEREVISITGMGGIGKTTLAKNVYEDKDIKRHFDIRAWITVSQSYSLDDLLRVLLQSIDASSPTEKKSAGTFKLKDKVRKLLLGKRYLIAIGFDHRTHQKCHSFLAMFPSEYGIRSREIISILTNYLFTATSIQVLDLLPLRFPYFQSLWINNLSQLRYLALYIAAFPASFSILSSLKNLQTLILQSARSFKVVYLTLPKTPQLRELCILRGSLFHFKNEEENFKLENLTTLLRLSDLCCNNEALMVRIPNVKKLGVRYEEAKRGDSMHPIDLLRTLSHLEQLEDIRFYGYDLLLLSRLVYIPKSYDFPPKLKKLKFLMTWMKLGITMTILGRLPNLEVLQLNYGAFDDFETEWEQVEEGFPKLKVLVFKNPNLRRWKDSNFTFPSLECLVLNVLGYLESLPYECLSGCPCLKLIDLKWCHYSVLESAKKIQNDGDGQLEVREENIFVRSK